LVVVLLTRSRKIFVVCDDGGREGSTFQAAVLLVLVSEEATHLQKVTGIVQGARVIEQIRGLVDDIGGTAATRALVVWVRDHLPACLERAKVRLVARLVGKEQTYWALVADRVAASLPDDGSTTATVSIACGRFFLLRVSFQDPPKRLVQLLRCGRGCRVELEGTNVVAADVSGVDAAVLPVQLFFIFFSYIVVVEGKVALHRGWNVRIDRLVSDPPRSVGSDDR
jgi:hypothetical protein